VTKHFIRARICGKRRADTIKYFTAVRLTWGAGLEKMGWYMTAKSNPRKKTGRAIQRDLDTKIEFLAGIVRRDPNYVDALQLLGDHYTQRGLFQEGLKVDERLAKLEPESSLVFYNLACSYSLTEHYDQAMSALDRALDLGYRDFAWLAKDPDLKKLRRQDAYADIKAKIRTLLGTKAR